MTKTAALCVTLTVTLTNVGGGCTGDVPAPSDYLASGGGSETLSIDCSDIPQAAVGATFDYTPQVGDPGGPLTFDLVGDNLRIPDGLQFDGDTATIAGVPRETGSHELRIRVRDVRGNTAVAECTLDIAPQLALDVDAMTEFGCARPSQSLRSFVVDGTGDGSAFSCSFDAGEGDGALPEGLAVDPERCVVTGTTTEQSYGTQVFVMRGQQSGIDVYVPYCVTQDAPPAGSYAIEADHSGLSEVGTPPDAAALIPAVAMFDPEQPLRLGDPDGNSPMDAITFRIVSPEDCGANVCRFRYIFTTTPSPFDPEDPQTDPDQLLLDDNDVPIGFSHALSWTGDAPGEAFAQRPFVATIGFDYCIAPDAEPCDTNEKIRTNGDGHLDFAVIMWPL